MMFCNFQTTTHAKWILAGEHTVLRGHGALVFPIKEKKLTLRFSPRDSELQADFSGHSSDEMHLLFWSVLEHGQQLLGQSLNRLTGHFHLESDIPIGVGMGASAALCVAMARWFNAQNLLINDSIASFGMRLENLFHGKSSGLDIAGVAAETGIYFKQGVASEINKTWQPQWYLSSSGQVGMTSHCINQVNSLWQKDSQHAAEIDKTMSMAVDKCRLALETNSSSSLKLLQDAIQECADCFEAWGLISDNLLRHMQLLQAHGALAVKPTGSGSGGFVVSLWDKTPKDLPFELIAV